jgi:hypothetical protein
MSLFGMQILQVSLSWSTWESEVESHPYRGLREVLISALEPRMGRCRSGTFKNGDVFVSWEIISSESVPVLGLAVSSQAEAKINRFLSETFALSQVIFSD